jgi:hypothetical protein
MELPIHIRQRHGFSLNLELPNRPRRHIPGLRNPHKRHSNLLFFSFSL